MGTTRQSIIRGPGTVAFGGVKFFDASGITAEIDSATQKVPSSIAGKLDTIKTDQTGKVTLTPVGNLSEALLGVLFPAWMQTPVIGTSLFGTTDAPLVISSRAGTKLTFNAAALTKCPDLLLSPVKTAFGQAEFTALLPNGKLPDDGTTKLYTVASAAYADGEPPREGLTGFHYSGTYGQLVIPDTKDGWTIAPTATMTVGRRSRRLLTRHTSLCSLECEDEEVFIYRLVARSTGCHYQCFALV